MDDAPRSDPAPFFANIAEAPAGGAAIRLHAADGVRLRAAVWPSGVGGGGRGTVLLFNGRSEYIEKYGRMIGLLTGKGFAVATLDWRGQGLSARPPGGTAVGHVMDFAEYQRDVEAFLAAPEVAALGGPRVLLCHSMGGCIGLRAMVDGRIAPAAAIFSAPMWGLNMPRPARHAAAASARLAVAAGFGERHAPGGLGPEFYVLAESFSNNVLTSDPEYWDWFGAQLRAHPDLGLGAPSFAWVGAAIAETEALAKAAPPAVPTLVLLGREERVVSAAAIRAQVRRAEGARLAMITGARHEPLMERFDGPVGAQVWTAVDDFLAAQGI